MSIGQKIYELRTAKNMSQGDLANELDVSRQSVSKWETDAAVPDLDKLIKLADVFEVSLDELTGRVISQSSMTKEHVEAKSTGITQQQIIGCILFVASLVGVILTIVFIEDIMIPNFTIPFSALTLICSIIFLCGKKNIAYWVTWTILSMLSFFIVLLVPVPVLSGVLVAQITTLLILAFIGKKLYKSAEIETSKQKNVLLALVWGISIVMYLVALFVIPGPTVAWCIVVYGIYIGISLLMTYTICYLRTLKNHK